MLPFTAVAVARIEWYVQHPMKEEKVSNVCKFTYMTLITRFQNGENLFKTCLRDPAPPTEASTTMRHGVVSDLTTDPSLIDLRST